MNIRLLQKDINLFVLKENIKICGVDIIIIFFNQTLRFFFNYELKWKSKWKCFFNEKKLCKLKFDKI